MTGRQLIFNVSLGVVAWVGIILGVTWILRHT